MLTPQQQLFQSLVDDVTLLTKRPELDEEIALYVQQATITAHNLAFFPRDLEVKVVQLPNAVNIFQLDIPSLFPRLRSLESVRGLDVNGNPTTSPKIDIVEIGEVYDPVYTSMLRANIAYVGGTSLNIRAPITGAAMVSYYAAPNTRPDFYNSWIAQLFPQVITQRAAQLLFNDTGDDEKSARKEKMLNNGRGGGLEWDLIRNYGLSQAH